MALTPDMRQSRALRGSSSVLVAGDAVVSDLLVAHTAHTVLPQRKSKMVCRATTAQLCMNFVPDQLCCHKDTVSVQAVEWLVQKSRISSCFITARQCLQHAQDTIAAC